MATCSITAFQIFVSLAFCFADCSSVHSAARNQCIADGGDEAVCKALPGESLEGPVEQCNASLPDCARLAEDGECEKNPQSMYSKCQNSCGACESECKDTHSDCRIWAHIGECKANPEYMFGSCRRSCHRCRKGLKEPDAKDEDESDECRDKHSKCEIWADQGECSKNPGYMLSHCPVNCAVCKVGDPHPSLLPECQDKRNDCFSRAVEGECLRNSAKMFQECPRSCRVCGERDPCRPNMSDEGTFYRTGLLNETFERIIAAHNVTVYSRDPYAVMIHNFFPVEIIGAVQDVFQDGWERSRVGGVSGADTTNEIRTSQQIWCKKECEAKPALAKLTNKVEELLGIPRRRFEDLQVLRYLPGQYYREHHDYINEQIYFPCGPRVLTMYLYLNDVPEGAGGETVFTTLKVKVRPIKGSALLWAHVFDHDPLRIDERTNHRALPPTGNNTKYAMNFWIHQFDFRRYNDLECLASRRPRGSYTENSYTEKK